MPPPERRWQALVLMGCAYVRNADAVGCVWAMLSYCCWMPRIERGSALPELELNAAEVSSAHSRVSKEALRGFIAMRAIQRANT